MNRQRRAGEPWGVLRGLGGVAALAAVGLLAVACGQPEATPAVGGAAPASPLAASPRIASPPVASPPGYWTTATAVARVPTLPGGVPTPFPTPEHPIATTPFPTYTGIPEMPTPIYTAPAPPTPNPDAPYTYTLYADRIPNTAISTGEARLIVIGTVTRVLPARWDTPDGRRPANPWATWQQISIFTPVYVAVEEEIKGASPQREVLLYAFGGQVGRDIARREPDRDDAIGEGERVVLFLSERTHEPQTLDGSPLWDITERYSITPDGRATNTYRTIPLAQLRAETADALR
ncbi:MAG TPA: hypothetical protein VFL91_05975 [Thermomicrobiales bacterium]|nr:hypothetical protein [Thermomicrobiales bacterium]